MSRDVPDDNPTVRSMACEVAVMALIDALNRNGQQDVAQAAFKSAMSYSIQLAEIEGGDKEFKIAGHTQYLFRCLDPDIPRYS
ncbi:hypothetical protein [Stutzerimonas xanthomarina]|uniref:hypothetical protein n=1 Tax=Stutzerimonas xanthomarina TaxID=271420 RepID=UPI003AA8889B